AILQHLLRVFGSFRPHQGLRSHKISRRVFGMAFEQNRELCQRAVEVSLLGVLHGEAVARERVFRIFRQDFVERCNAVHSMGVALIGPCRRGYYNRDARVQRMLAIAPSTDYNGHSPRKLREEFYGVSLLHAGNKAGKWFLAPSRQASARRWMVRPLHSSRPRRRSPRTRCAGSILQLGIRKRLFLVSDGTSVGRSALRHFRSERC